MNKYLLTFAIILFFTGCRQKPEAPVLSSSYQVINIIDGDTFWILNHQNKREKIRLIGIDAPESRKSQHKEIQYFGIEASNFLKKLLHNEYVYLEYDIQKKDQYQRTLAYVYLKDGTFLNEYLVNQGYAKSKTYQPNVKYTNTLKNAERNARKHQLGLWRK